MKNPEKKFDEDKLLVIIFIIGNAIYYFLMWLALQGLKAH